MNTKWKVILITAFLLTGTLTSISNKMMLETKVSPADGEPPKKFNKPWFQVWGMFLGMTLIGPLMAMHRAYKSAGGGELRPLVAVEGSSAPSMGKVILMVCGPAVCDLLATFFQNVGLVFCSVSIWQMMRGSIAIFSAAQRYCYLGVKPERYESVGVLVVTIGLVIVGYASVLMPDDDPNDAGASNVVLAMVGIGCVLIAQVIQAWQTVIEEKLLHNVELDPCFIVFLEGAWGLVFTTVIFMPLAQLLPGTDGMGVHEDVLPEEAYMLGHSGLLIVTTVVYITVIMSYNITGMIVCDETEATTRNVIDACRALCVWVLAILIEAVSPGAPGGEKLGIWSFYELAGFLVLVLGLFLYYNVIKIDRLQPPEERCAAQQMQQSLQPVTA